VVRPVAHTAKKCVGQLKQKYSLNSPSTVFSRNQLMNDNAEWYLDHSEETTDILHEYFVGREHAGEFLIAARKIIREHNADLLNVTVRDVTTDHDTFLNYATQDTLAL
jgi:hypothetical protein